MIRFLVLSLCVGLSLGLPQLQTLSKAANVVAGLIDGCKKQESAFLNKPKACALLFDKSNCRDLKRDVPEGYTQLGFRDRNDVESVLVKQGCSLIGYDSSSENVYKRGKSVGISAFGSRSPVGKTLSGKKDLESEIESVECKCGVKMNTEKCSQPFPKDTACIVYDGNDCTIDNWSNPVFLKSGEDRSFSILKGLSNIMYKNDAKSLSVLKGCTLEVFDDTKFSNDQKKFTAGSQDLHVNLGDSWRTKSLNKDIGSLRCYCNK